MLNVIENVNVRVTSQDLDIEDGNNKMGIRAKGYE
jgi:hypothetical protein